MSTTTPEPTTPEPDEPDTTTEPDERPTPDVDVPPRTEGDEADGHPLTRR